MRRRVDHPGRDFAMWLVIAIVASVVVAGLLAFVPACLVLASDDPDPAALQQSAQRLLVLHEHFWTIAAAQALGTGLVGLFLYRKMSKPRERFRHLYAAIATGDLPAEIRLRGSDYLHEDADAINAMVEGLQARTDQVREAFEDASRRASGEVSAAQKELGERIDALPRRR